MVERMPTEEDVYDQLRILEAGWMGRKLGVPEAFRRWWAEELERLWAISEAVLLIEEQDLVGEDEEEED